MGKYGENVKVDKSQWFDGNIIETKGERREKKKRKKQEMKKNGAGLRDTFQRTIERSEQISKKRKMNGDRCC